MLHNSSDNSLLVAEPNPELYSEKGILIAKSITDSNLLKQYLLVLNIFIGFKDIINIWIQIIDLRYTKHLSYEYELMKKEMIWNRY